MAEEEKMAGLRRYGIVMEEKEKAVVGGTKS